MTVGRPEALDAAGVEAAERVTLELFTVLGEFRDCMTVVGGAVPPLLVGESSEDPYVGTLDVDVVIDPVAVPEETYRSISEQLVARGYERAGQPYQWKRTVSVNGREVAVRVDLLAPMTDRRGATHRHEAVGDVWARRVPGAELLRDHHERRTLRGRLPDGRPNEVEVRIASAAALIVLKALALDGRDREKDSYDIDYVLGNIPGGIPAVVDDLRPLATVPVVRTALEILARKFSDPDAYGPASVAGYRRARRGSDEADQVTALAYARVRRLLDLLGMPAVVPPTGGGSAAGSSPVSG